jgi:hypothetical protein
MCDICDNYNKYSIKNNYLYIQDNCGKHKKFKIYNLVNRKVIFCPGFEKLQELLENRYNTQTDIYLKHGSYNYKIAIGDIVDGFFRHRQQFATLLNNINSDLQYSGFDLGVYNVYFGTESNRLSFYNTRGYIQGWIPNGSTYFTVSNMTTSAPSLQEKINFTNNTLCKTVASSGSYAFAPILYNSKSIPSTIKQFPDSRYKINNANITVNVVYDKAPNDPAVSVQPEISDWYNNNLIVIAPSAVLDNNRLFNEWKINLPPYDGRCLSLLLTNSSLGYEDKLKYYMILNYTISLNS